jgi:hypothetical protein
MIAKRLLQDLLDEDQLPENFCSDDPKKIITTK